MSATLSLIPTAAGPALPTLADLRLAGVYAREREDFCRFLAETGLTREHGAIFMGCSSAFGWFHFPASPEFCQQLARWLTTDGNAHGVQEDRRAAH